MRKLSPQKAPWFLSLLTRKSSNLANLEGITGETVVGDLSDLASLQSRSRTAMRLCMWRQIMANVDGTRELSRLAREAGV